MILCKNCGHPIESILANCFERDGSDTDYMFTVREPVEGVAEFDLPPTWCGYELSEEEQMDCIICPHCKRFPFSASAGINVETRVFVVCFEERGAE